MRDLSLGRMQVIGSVYQTCLVIPSIKVNDERLSGKCYVNPWIIDMGASNRVIENCDLLHNVTNMAECPIGLPDGKQKCSTKHGEVYLAPV